MLLVNGIPLVVIEAKTPVRSSQSWLDGALQVHDDYERNVPELFVPNVFSIATEGKEYRYGVDRHAGRVLGAVAARGRRRSCRRCSRSRRRSPRCCGPQVVLDLLANFTSYATHKGKQRIKIIARYQQYEGANKIVERVVAGPARRRA